MSPPKCHHKSQRDCEIHEFILFLKVPGPKLANCLENGLTPMRLPAELAVLGFTIAAYPLSLLAVRHQCAACLLSPTHEYGFLAHAIPIGLHRFGIHRPQSRPWTTCWRFSAIPMAVEQLRWRIPVYWLHFLALARRLGLRSTTRASPSCKSSHRQMPLGIEEQRVRSRSKSTAEVWLLFVFL